MPDVPGIEENMNYEWNAWSREFLRRIFVHALDAVLESGLA